MCRRSGVGGLVEGPGVARGLMPLVAAPMDSCRVAEPRRKQTSKQQRGVEKGCINNRGSLKLGGQGKVWIAIPDRPLDMW